MQLSDLRKLVRQGEGYQLEFKLKAKYPEKIIREMVAFANSEGGTLLLGVDDLGAIFGSKNPEEDQTILEEYIQKYTVPKLQYKVFRVPVNARREVIGFTFKSSFRKPHFVKFPLDSKEKTAYIRVKDMSIKASREMVSILRHEKDKQGVSLRIGEAEKTLLAHFETHATLTLDQAQQLLKGSLRQASGKLIILTRAGILCIHASKHGDTFSLNKKAFENP